MTPNDLFTWKQDHYGDRFVTTFPAILQSERMLQVQTNLSALQKKLNCATNQTP